MTENNGIERRREAIAAEGRFTKLETQVDRLISDAESEKETRARVNLGITQDFLKMSVIIEKLEKRVLHMEYKIYGFAGAMSAFVYLIHWIFK